MDVAKYTELARHYEACFIKHGPGHLGVDWPDSDGAGVRYRVMLGVLDSSKGDVSLLDFGCGDAALLNHLRAEGLADRVTYHGHDISEIYIDYCRSVHPSIPFTSGDVLTGSLVPVTDYTIANGVFTERLSLSYEEMFSFMTETVSALFESARCGIAFNVMTKDVDWERNDLFHVPLAEMAEFVAQLSRRYTIRQDYGLFEYTTYVYKEG